MLKLKRRIERIHGCIRRERTLLLGGRSRCILVSIHIITRGRFRWIKFARLDPWIRICSVLRGAIVHHTGLMLHSHGIRFVHHIVVMGIIRFRITRKRWYAVFLFSMKIKRWLYYRCRRISNQWSTSSRIWRIRSLTSTWDHRIFSRETSNIRLWIIKDWKILRWIRLGRRISIPATWHWLQRSTVSVLERRKFLNSRKIRILHFSFSGNRRINAHLLTIWVSN